MDKRTDLYGKGYKSYGIGKRISGKDEDLIGSLVIKFELLKIARNLIMHQSLLGIVALTKGHVDLFLADAQRFTGFARHRANWHDLQRAVYADLANEIRHSRREAISSNLPMSMIGHTRILGERFRHEDSRKREQQKYWGTAEGHLGKNHRRMTQVADAQQMVNDVMPVRARFPDEV